MLRQLSSIKFKDGGDRFSNVSFSKLRKSIYGTKTIVIKHSKSFQWCLLFTAIIQFIIIIGMCFIVDWPKQINNIKTLVRSNLQGENRNAKNCLGFGKIECLQDENMQVKGNIVFGNTLNSNIVLVFIYIYIKP